MSRVLHIGTLPLERMSPNTRLIVRSLGHEYATLDEYRAFPSMDAEPDVIVLECFKKRHDEFEDFAPRSTRTRLVSMVHSTPPCMPSRFSDRIVCQSHHSASQVSERFRSARIDVIPSSAPIMEGWPDYESRVMGRITRNAPGKFHDEWWTALKHILRNVQGSSFLLYVDKDFGLIPVIDGLGVEAWPPYAEQALFLQRMSLGVFAHGDFEETLCSSAIELMAAGVPIVYLYQPSLHEVIGESQTCCASISELVDEVEALLVSPAQKRAMGVAAREWVRERYDPDVMLGRWSALIEEVLL